MIRRGSRHHHHHFLLKAITPLVSDSHAAQSVLRHRPMIGEG
jgi:hypothetical protein